MGAVSSATGGTPDHPARHRRRSVRLTDLGRWRRFWARTASTCSTSVFSASDDRACSRDRARLQCGHQAVIVEYQWAQRPCHISHAIERAFDQCDRIIEPDPDSGGGSRGQLIADQVKIEIDGSQVLTDAIVQLGRELAPLAFLDLDDAARDGLQLLRVTAGSVLGAFARRDVDHGGTRMDEVAAFLAHARNPQERVEHGTVLAHQFDLDLRGAMAREHAFQRSLVRAVMARGDEFSEPLRAAPASLLLIAGPSSRPRAHARRLRDLASGFGRLASTCPADRALGGTASPHRAS